LKVICPECKKEFEINFAKALAYSLNNEDKPKCDKCIFDNVFSKLDEDFNVNIYDEKGKVKSFQEVLSELSNEYKKI
jgi:hypothetical protein